MDFHRRMLTDGLAMDDPINTSQVNPQVLVFVKAIGALITASSFTLSYFQQSLNERTGTFGGSHRSAAFVRLAYNVLQIAGGLESFVGAYSSRPGVKATVAAAAFFAGREAWQALTLERVKEEEEHEE